eukprot:1467882-Pyramimonas_sp.AAC.1
MSAVTARVGGREGTSPTGCTAGARAGPGPLHVMARARPFPHARDADRCCTLRPRGQPDQARTRSAEAAHRGGGGLL